MKRAVLTYCMLSFMLLDAYAQDLAKVTFYPGTPINEQLSDSVQYRFPSFTEGVVTTKKEGAVRAKLNYNFLFGEMQFLDEKGERLSIGNPEDVVRISISNCTFIYFKGDYYEVIQSGSVCLLKKQLVELQSQGNDAPYGLKSQSSSVDKPMHLFSRGGSYSVNSTQSFYIKRKVSFYLQNGTKILPVQGENTFKKVFPKRADLITPYVVSNKVDFSNSEDLTKLLTYLSSLQ